MPGEKKASGQRVPLSALKKGQSGTVEQLLPSDEKDLQKFLTLGLIPGEGITVLHHRPLYVILVGHTQIALDEKGAAAIFVRRS